MADNDHHGSHVPGTMDISQNTKTYLAFWAVSKWVVGGCILLAIFLAMFRT